MQFHWMYTSKSSPSFLGRGYVALTTLRRTPLTLRIMEPPVASEQVNNK
jgi:hypothetical protein